MTHNKALEFVLCWARVNECRFWVKDNSFLKMREVRVFSPMTGRFIYAETIKKKMCTVISDLEFSFQPIYARQIWNMIKDGTIKIGPPELEEDDEEEDDYA